MSLFKIHKTIFEKSIAIEFVDIDNLQLIENSEEWGKDEVRRLRLQKYRNDYNPETGKEVIYRTNKKKLGRLEADLSMCDEESIIRTAICYNLYWDIDGINMGYQIFYQAYTVLTANNPKAEELTSIKSYIIDRDFWFNLVYDAYFKLFEKENTEVKKAIKELFIRLLNGGSVKKWKQDYGVNDMTKMIPLIGVLEKEIKLATKTLFDYLPEYKIAKKSNPEKDTISHFIYETEKKCVEQLYIALGCPKTYMYCKDGIMVLKKDFTKSQIETIIDLAKAKIFAMYCLEIDFKIKPMVSEIDIDDLTPRQPSGYEVQRELFEQKYCKIKDLVVFPYRSCKNVIKFHSEKQIIGAERDFCHRVSKLFKENGKEVIREVRFIEEWLDDPKKKKYDDIDMYPSDIVHTCPSNIYNLWTPFIAEDYEPCPEDELIDELEFLLNHILILCNHEKAIYDYFIRWFGQMLKYPSVKSTAPTFISEEGAGKGSLFELFRRVMGDNKVLETTKPEMILGNHNTLLINSFLVIFNELDQSKIKQYGGDIKSFITDKSVQINPKGKDQFPMLSFHRLLNATNGENPIPVLHGNDRRNVIVRCSDELCKNQVYFDKFYDCLNSKKLIRKFYDYCYNLDGLDKLTLPPRTEHHNVLINGNICHVKEFMKDCTFSWAAQNIEDKEITPLQLYQNMKTWIDEHGFKFETNAIHLIRKIGLLKIPNSKGRAKGSRYVSFNINDLIKYFNLTRNEDHELILEEAAGDGGIEEPPLERLEKIILRHLPLGEEVKNLGVNNDMIDGIMDMLVDNLI